MAAAGKPWHLIVHGRHRQRPVARAASLRALQNHRDTLFWIRNRRGRKLEAFNVKTQETWEYTPRGWFRRQDGAA